MERNTSVSDQQWNCCYQKLPRSQFAFFAQVIIIYIVIIAAIINISLDTPEKTYWFYILGSVTGILFPSPSLKKPKVSPIGTPSPTLRPLSAGTPPTTFTQTSGTPPTTNTTPPVSNYPISLHQGGSIV